MPMYPAMHPAKIAREMGADFVFDNSRAKNAPMILLASGSTNSTYDNTDSEINDATAQMAYDTLNPKNANGVANSAAALIVIRIGFSNMDCTSHIVIIYYDIRHVYI